MKWADVLLSFLGQGSGPQSARSNPRPGSNVMFMHLPKCGGTTIGQSVRERVADEKILVADSTIVSDPSAYRFIRGHLNVEYVLGPDLADFRKVTLLRDPIDRLISSCNFQRSYTPDNPSYGHLVPRLLRASSPSDLPDIIK